MISNYRQTNIVWPYELHMIDWITFWQYDWCVHPTQVHLLFKYLGIVHYLLLIFDDFPVWWMSCYCLSSLEQTEHNLSSEHSMIICLHRTSLIMFSCHFRYFVVVLLGFEKWNMLLYHLQMKSILNVLCRQNACGKLFV